MRTLPVPELGAELLSSKVTALRVAAKLASSTVVSARPQAERFVNDWCTRSAWFNLYMSRPAAQRRVTSSRSKS
jgi:hypothetical protein